MQVEKKPGHPEKDSGLGPVESCNCMNCRMARMEEAIGKMQESVLRAIEEKNPLPGMPKERNRMRGK